MCTNCGDMKHKVGGEESTRKIVKAHGKKHRIGAIKKVMEKMKK